MDQKNEIRPAARGHSYILVTIAVFAAFVIFGFSENVKGPAIPRMQAEFNVTELQLGLLLAVNAFGYLMACSYTAALAKRIGIKTCLIIALAVMAGSGAGICLSTGYPALLASFFILYLGNGMLEISLNVIAATIFTKNTGTMMSLAHFFYGAGSVFAPIVSAGLMAARFAGGGALGWRYMYLIVLGCALIPAIPALFGRLGKKDGGGVKKSGYAALLKKPSLWLTVLILSLAMVCEMGLGAWLVNYLEKAHSFPADRAALMLTLFFVAFTLARLVLGPLIDKFGFINSLAAVTAFSGVMIAAGVLLGGSGVALIVAAGVGVAPIYPTIMAVISKLFSAEIDLAMTVVTTGSGIFVMVSDFLLGGIVYFSRLIFTNIYGEAGVGIAYAAGCLFMGLCCFGAFAAAMVLRRRQKKAGQLV